MSADDRFAVCRVRKKGQPGWAWVAWRGLGREDVYKTGTARVHRAAATGTASNEEAAVAAALEVVPGALRRPNFQAQYYPSQVEAEDALARFAAQHALPEQDLVNIELARELARSLELEAYGDRRAYPAATLAGTILRTSPHLERTRDLLEIILACMRKPSKPPAKTRHAGVIDLAEERKRRRSSP